MLTCGCLQWDESFEFPLVSGVERKLFVQLYDRDMIKVKDMLRGSSADDFLGCVVVDFSTWRDDEQRDLWLPLLETDNVTRMPSGELHVQVTSYI